MSVGNCCFWETAARPGLLFPGCCQAWTSWSLTEDWKQPDTGSRKASSCIFIQHCITWKAMLYKYVVYVVKNGLIWSVKKDRIQFFIVMSINCKRHTHSKLNDLIEWQRFGLVVNYAISEWTYRYLWTSSSSWVLAARTTAEVVTPGKRATSTPGWPIFPTANWQNNLRVGLFALTSLGHLAGPVTWSQFRDPLTLLNCRCKKTRRKTSPYPISLFLSCIGME